MWSLKSIEIRKNTRAKLVAERVKMLVIATFNDGTEEIIIDFTARNKQEMDDTLISITSGLNQLEDTIANIDAGEGYIPTTPPVPEPPVRTVSTPQELLREEQQAARNALELAKSDKVLGLITEQEYETKLADTKAILAKRINLPEPMVELPIRQL